MLLRKRQKTNNDLVCIKTFDNDEEAELAKNVLKRNDIEASVSADDLGRMDPALQWATGGVRLNILEKDRNKALRVLKDFKIK